MAQDADIPNSAPNRAPASSVIIKALANTRIGNNLIASLGTANLALVQVALNISPTDPSWSSLAVGDLIVHIPATAGNVSFMSVVTAGTNPFTPVAGDLYVDLRQSNLNAGSLVLGNPNPYSPY